MGFAVLHINKAKGSDSAMSAHIERTIKPKNVDETRTHLNEELIQFPLEVENRTQAIQYRLDNAGLTRKIGSNQTRVLRAMLSGTSEDMKRIEQEGKLKDWCNDNINWLKKTYGEKNVVSAVLHLDETTPHIHATIIPIVTGERRKTKLEENSTKKKYRKKNPNNARLCADDIMTRDKLEAFQDSYAECMSKYGLRRGIRGSEAKHITTGQYYRELYSQTKEIEEDVTQLQEQKEKAKQELSDIKSNINTQKLKETTVNVATSAMESIGSVFSSSKVKKQQQEIDDLKQDNTYLKNEVSKLNNRISANDTEHAKAIQQLQQELGRIYHLFPTVKELLCMDSLCRHVGFSEELTLKLLKLQPIKIANGSLYSAEFRRNFSIEGTTIKIERSSKTNRLLLTIDGVEITNWFKQKETPHNPRIINRPRMKL